MNRFYLINVVAVIMTFVLIITACKKEEDQPVFNLTLSVSPQQGGNVDGAGKYEAGETVSLSATPNEGYQFVNWTDGQHSEVSTSASFQFVMPGEDATLTANFAAARHTLTLAVNPSDAGTVDGEGDYEEGETVNLSATPNEGFQFINWTDGQHSEVSASASFQFVMPGEDVTLTANFAEVKHTLTLVVNPSNAGNVDGAGDYPQGATVSLTATPDAGFEFVNWTGDTDHVDDPQSASTIVTMPTGSVSLTANFIFTATSCLCLLEDGVTASGKYTILLDGTPTEVYCDMTTDGGGWTLVAVSAQGGSQWTWNNRSVFTTNRAVFGSLDDMDLSSQSFANNYKNTGLHDIEMEDVMVRWASDRDSKWASYHNVSDATQSLSSIIGSQPLSACLPHNQGFAKTAGNAFGSLGSGTERGYCGERLYFNLRHTGGELHTCGVGETNYSTYGPAFNYRWSNGNCTDGNSGPFNNPNNTGFGPCSSSRSTQRGVARNNSPWIDLGLSSDGLRRSMLLFVR